MKTKYTTLDRIAEVFLLLTVAYWLSAKTPIGQSIAFGAFYEATWLFFILFAVACPMYFLFQWIRTKFQFSTNYFYLSLIGIATVLLMVFVKKIELF